MHKCSLFCGNIWLFLYRSDSSRRGSTRWWKGKGGEDSERLPKQPLFDSQAHLAPNVSLYMPKSPTYLQQSLTDPLKSPTYLQMSPICKRSQYICKRALQIRHRALHIRKRALHIYQKSYQKSPTHPQKSPAYPYFYPPALPVPNVACYCPQPIFAVYDFRCVSGTQKHIHTHTLANNVPHPHPQTLFLTHTHLLGCTSTETCLLQHTENTSQHTLQHTLQHTATLTTTH